MPSFDKTTENLGLGASEQWGIGEMKTRDASRTESGEGQDQVECVAYRLRVLWEQIAKGQEISLGGSEIRESVFTLELPIAG